MEHDGDIVDAFDDKLFEFEYEDAKLFLGAEIDFLILDDG
jgi:hypothetical protein